MQTKAIPLTAQPSSQAIFKIRDLVTSSLFVWCHMQILLLSPDIRVILYDR